MRKQVDSTCVSDPSFFCSRTLLFSRSFPRLFSPWLIKWIFMLCLRMSDPLKSYFSLHSPSLYPTFWYFIDAKAYRRVSNPLYFFACFAQVGSDIYLSLLRLSFVYRFQFNSPFTFWLFSMSFSPITPSFPSIHQDNLQHCKPWSVHPPATPGNNRIRCTISEFTAADQQ